MLKICCAWCNKVYIPENQDIPAKRRDNCYCTQGCRDANILFLKYVELEHEKLYGRVHHNPLPRE